MTKQINYYVAKPGTPSEEWQYFGYLSDAKKEALYWANYFKMPVCIMTLSLDYSVDRYFELNSVIIPTARMDAQETRYSCQFLNALDKSRELRDARAKWNRK